MTADLYCCLECGTWWDKTVPDDEAAWRKFGICIVCWYRMHGLPEPALAIVDSVARAAGTGFRHERN